MPQLMSLEAVDYLVIGHITCDVIPGGLRLGGSAAYAALTARAMGLRVGVVTAWADEIPLTGFEGITVVSAPAQHATRFENIATSRGRAQVIHHVAPKIDFALVPEAWRRARIIHLAPVAQEVEPVLPPDFRPTLLGLTPQGWLRTWDAEGRVRPCAWPDAEKALRAAGAAVLSVEDVQHQEEIIEHMVLASRLLVVTEGAAGARLYWNHDLRRFRAPASTEVDPTGAGDIFAASFFVRLLATRDPWEAARFANQVAALSVTRPGLAGVPTPEEVQACLVEVIH
ncbi:MAG: PfkB family carbohydrate kinase [Anaerolineales bacterium]